MKRRRKGRGVNKGYYWDKTKLAWRVTRGPVLRDDGGKPIKEKHAAESVLEAAFKRQIHTQIAGVPSEGPTVFDLATAYLEYCQRLAAKKTVWLRQRTLFDFCYGLAPRALAKGSLLDVRTDMPDDQIAKMRIHPGFGAKPAEEVTFYSVDQWLSAHDWNGGAASHVTGIKAMFGYALDRKLVATNPVAAYVVPHFNSRVVYWTAEQEQLIYDNVPKAFGQVVNLLIGTGARPHELAMMTAEHVEGRGDKMSIYFKGGTKQAHDAQTRRPRRIHVFSAAHRELIRQWVAAYPEGPLLRDRRGRPYAEHSFAFRFTKLRAKLKKQGVICPKGLFITYTARHTFAKRMLSGYWSDSKPISLRTLAMLMGNSPRVCEKHYLAWEEGHEAEVLRGLGRD